MSQTEQDQPQDGPDGQTERNQFEGQKREDGKRQKLNLLAGGLPETAKLRNASLREARNSQTEESQPKGKRPN